MRTTESDVNSILQGSSQVGNDPKGDETVFFTHTDPGDETEEEYDY